MSAKHAWRYVRSGYGSKNADFDIVSERSGGRIASTPYEDKARLIAAAPDMDAAIDEAIEALDRHLVEDLMTAEETMALLETLRAARAKARGE